jgi:hypothetical protein
MKGTKKTRTGTLFPRRPIVAGPFEDDCTRTRDAYHADSIPVRGGLELYVHRHTRLGPGVSVAKGTAVDRGDERGAGRFSGEHGFVRGLALDRGLEGGEGLDSIRGDLGTRSGGAEVVGLPFVLQLLGGEGVVFAHGHAWRAAGVSDNGGSCEIRTLCDQVRVGRDIRKTRR